MFIELSHREYTEQEKIMYHLVDMSSKIRISISHIDSYHEEYDDEPVFTKVFTDKKTYSVKESPKEIDKLIAESIV